MMTTAHVAAFYANIKGHSWNSFNNEGYAKGLTMAGMIDELLKYEHPLVERGAIAEFDCTYCPAEKGGSCFVVLSGIKGSRLPDFAHIARRMLWVNKHGPLTQEQKDDYELEEMMKPAPWPLCREPGWLDEERGIRVATSPCYLCANNLPHPKPPPKVKKVIIQSIPPKPASTKHVEDLWLDGIMGGKKWKKEDSLDDLFEPGGAWGDEAKNNIEDLF